KRWPAVVLSRGNAEASLRCDLTTRETRTSLEDCDSADRIVNQRRDGALGAHFAQDPRRDFGSSTTPYACWLPFRVSSKGHLRRQGISSVDPVHAGDRFRSLARESHDHSCFRAGPRIRCTGFLAGTTDQEAPGKDSTWTSGRT